MTFHQFDPHVAFSDEGAHVRRVEQEAGAVLWFANLSTQSP
jgi:hypothetical protein